MLVIELEGCGCIVMVIFWALCLLLLCCTIKASSNGSLDDEADSSAKGHTNPIFFHLHWLFFFVFV